ncbi:transforming acidic coiled-coil-containing protein 2-like isoform X2 [Anoplophora glabripennis]|uniref:transforming acidic coiled-coil-containing protein 2-like isoform X2 n=1 Tax=Anoplophora glabripennis TaxID=217634 RepID=UPI000873E492|nr:transforming acidic coiled-coil-containing protein 2-like isoform X2 [Anoplophora glabripennis]
MNFVTSVLKKYIQNEPQEAVDDAPKQRDPVEGSSSDDKENGFALNSDTDKPDIGCGTNKPKESNSRRSILKSFDPLYKESPEKFQTASTSESYERPRRQLIIKESDESESEQTSYSAEVSDDETKFVDACTATDAACSEFHVPEIENFQQEESLLKFYTPEKVYVALKGSDSESGSTSDVAENQPVLINVETSTSSSDQSHIQKETICSTVLIPTVTESKIVSAINRKISSDSDIIPTRSKFTISESELENCNILRETFSPENRVETFRGRQENAADAIEANSLTSVSEIRNISPERSVVTLESRIRNDESTLAEEPQSLENRTLGVSEVIEKEGSSDNSKESEITVIDNKSILEVNVGEKDHIFSDISEANTDCTIPETKLQSSAEEFSVLEGAVEDFDEYIKEGSSKINRHQKYQLPLQPECESKLEDKLTVNQESFREELSKETFQNFEKTLGSNTDFASGQDSKIPQEHVVSDCGADAESNQQLEISQKNLDSSCETEFERYRISEHPQKQLTSDSEGKSEFRKETEKPQKHLDLDIELKSKKLETSEVNEGNLEYTELDVTYKKVEETTAEVERKPESSEEKLSEKKTEELDNNTSETQKPSDVHFEAVAESDDTISIHHDEEHHLDSGLDSIEESYTKSPKSHVGDFEGSAKGEEEKISPDKKDSCSPDEKLSHTHDKLKIIPVDETTSDENTKIDAIDSTQDEQPRLLDKQAKPRIEDEPKLAELTEPGPDRTIISLTDQKSKMADLSEKLNQQQQENSDLKLQLNAIQQAKASLELEIRQKEEVIIKTQAEALKNEQTYKQEIKQLREKLKENSKLIEKDGSKELEDQLKEAKAREAKAVAELNQRTKDDLNYQKIMEEYENTIATRFADYQKLKEEHETATRHLANIELAFSDVHQKYERTKALLEGFKSNEETLNGALQVSERTLKQHEERYESLKAHAKGQIEKSNKEILMLRDKYEMDINKLKAIIKRLEIKCSSLEVSLQQKTEECAALSALCDEVTGKKV